MTSKGKTGPKPRDLAERFWEKVDRRGEDECWPWLASIRPNGYGQMGSMTRGMPTLAHRESYRINKGPIPKGAVVRHSCDNRWCVNPNHLLIGTQGDNNADTRSRGRNTKGDTHGRRKLSSSQVMAIRSAPQSNGEIGKIYGLNKGHVCAIRNGRAWSHIND